MPSYCYLYPSGWQADKLQRDPWRWRRQLAEIDHDGLRAALDAYLSATSRLSPVIPTLFQAGATAAEIATAEARMGRRLPPELAALLALRNGTMNDEVVLPDWTFYALDRLVEEWLIWKDLYDREFVAEGIDCDPEGPIRGDEWWRPAWIPFTGNGLGDHLCLDMDPAEGGVVGQVIAFFHDDGRRHVVAPSLRDYLHLVTAEVEAGATEWFPNDKALLFKDVAEG